MTATLTKLVADFQTQLASVVSVGDTTCTLQSVADSDGNNIPNGVWGFTIDNNSAARKEFFIGTISGTSVTNVFSISRQGAVTTGFARPHRRGAQIIVSDWVALKRIQSLLDGTTGFDSAVKIGYDADPALLSSDLTKFATIKYVNDTAFNVGVLASTTTAGYVQEATQAEVDARTVTGSSTAKLFAPLDKIRASKYHDYAADAGSNDTYAITIVPAITAYSVGQVFQFKANTANTGACTLNVSGLGAKSLKMNSGLDPVDGYIKAGQVVQVVYDGTNMQIQSVSGKPSLSQTGEEVYAASSSGNDTYVITLIPAPVAYVTGMTVRFKPDTANTGAATLNVNGLGAKAIKKAVSQDLVNGDILENQMVEVIYDGTNFQLSSPSANFTNLLYSLNGTQQTPPSTTPVTCASYTIPANTFIVGDVLRVTIAITVTAGNSNSMVATLTIGGNSVKVWSNTGTPQTYVMKTVLECIVTASTIEVTDLTLGSVSSNLVTTMSGSANVQFYSQTSVSFNPASSNVLLISAVNSTGNGGASATVSSLIVEKI